jgi:hypothetical protein
LALFLPLVLLLAAPAAWSQSSTFARLIGTVTDQSGGVIPGVTVTAVNKGTAISRTAITNERGDFLIDKLAPGTYDVTVEQPGFRKQVAADVKLAVEQVGRVDFALTAGGVADQVTVTGQTPVIDTASAELGAVVDEKKILDLPLSGRKLNKLAYLTTGGVQQNSTTTDSAIYGGGLPAFNGLDPTSNQVNFDGANNLGITISAAVISPTPETVQEFKVITNNYSAEYGRVSGAVISLVSRSGTNQFHGHGWEYLSNEALNANSFFNNRVGRAKPPVDRHIFGGAVGGPIFKNKTFFFGNYEHFIDDFSAPAFQTVPTLAERTGDFSKGDGPWGNVPIYDPANVVNGLRVQIPNNVIPATRINPISKKILDLVPYQAPNTAGAANNYSYLSETSQRRTKWSGRVDHHFANGQTLFGRYSWQEAPKTLHTGGVGVPGMKYGVYQAINDHEHGWQTAAGWVSTIGGSAVNELNFSAWDSKRLTVGIDDINWVERFGYDIADKVQLVAPDGGRGPGGMPGVSITGYTGYSGYGSEILGDWGMNFKDTVAFKRGNHYLKAGFEHMRVYNIRNRWVPEGSASNTFDGYQTGQIATGGSTFGQPFADFLLGASSSVSANILGGGGYGTGGFGQLNLTTYNAFVQDDWRVSPNLTLTLGLRWELPMPPTYLFNKYNCGFDVSGGRNNPVQLVPKDFPLTSDFVTGGNLASLAVPFRELDKHTCQDLRLKYWAPRVGMAWRLFGTNRTVLRAGYGISYDQDVGNAKAAPGYLGPFNGRVSDVQVRGAAPRLLIGQYKTLPPASATEHVTDYFYDSTYQEGAVHSYSFGIQHELGKGTKLEVSYVGNQSRHIRHLRFFNVAMPEGTRVQLLTGESFNVTGTQRNRRPYPLIRPNFITTSDGDGNYNSAQFKVERQFTRGVAISSGFTWSRAFALNYPGAWFEGNIPYEFDRNYLHGPMRFDRPRTFYFSGLWELPFFKAGNRLKTSLLGGWEVNSIISLADGSVFGPLVSRDLWDQGPRKVTYGDRIADGNLDESQRTVTRYFDTAAFTTPINFKMGNSSRAALREDGIAVADISLHKAFAITESKSLDFRLDMFNAFNHAIFQRPNSTLDSAAYGQVTGTGDPRIMQLGFRFSF